MPFLSDMLDQSRRQQDEEQALARENLAEASLLQAHLSHRSALHSRFRFDPAAVMDCLRAEVLGQEPALQAVEDMLKVVRADIATRAVRCSARCSSAPPGSARPRSCAPWPGPCTATPRGSAGWT